MLNPGPLLPEEIRADRLFAVRDHGCAHVLYRQLAISGWTWFRQLERFEVIQPRLFVVRFWKPASLTIS
jgi:hypothetical protein